MGIERILPLSELEDDRAASITDIKLCEWALLHGHQYFAGGTSVQGRLVANQEVVKIIDAELLRREELEDERKLRD